MEYVAITKKWTPWTSLSSLYVKWNALGNSSIERGM